MYVSADDRVHEQRKADGGEDCAAHVEAALGVLPAAFWQEENGGNDRGDADRDVDEQHPSPRQVGGQHAAQNHAEGAAEAGDRRPGTERAVPLLALAERGHDDRQSRG
jgi:hypothetical protein